MPRRSSCDVTLGGEGQPLRPTVLQLGDLPEADATRVKPPLCPACGGRLTRMPGAAWMAYCSRRQCPRRLGVEATWVPGQWVIIVPD
jgi:hypothetical protein